jgi:phage N-6-adenine-methyltransferase
MENNEWSTPQVLYNLLNEEFFFNLDACASVWNRKSSFFYTKEVSCLVKNWPIDSIAWMNPPYGREIEKFIEQAYKQYLRGCTVVCLVPSRTETKWFTEYCLKGELRFVRGRIHFIDKDGISGRPRFGNTIVIFKPGNKKTGTASVYDKYRGGK